MNKYSMNVCVMTSPVIDWDILGDSPTTGNAKRAVTDFRFQINKAEFPVQVLKPMEQAYVYCNVSKLAKCLKAVRGAGGEVAEIIVDSAELFEKADKQIRKTKLGDGLGFLFSAETGEEYS